MMLMMMSFVHVDNVLMLLMNRMDRLPFIPFFLERWPAYLSISIQCKVNEVSQVEKEITKLNLPDRVTVIILTVSRMNDKFYVNRLRNLAITAIRTTHFLTLDMDMWPVGRNEEWMACNWQRRVLNRFGITFLSFLIHFSFIYYSFIIYHFA